MIYLDNAATTYPKPRSVLEETLRCMSRYGGNAGRGAHPLAMAATEKIFECRTLAAELFGVLEPERVCFTLNTTYGINVVLKGLLRRGDHVLISDMEHNAVYRPLCKLAEERGITFDCFPSMVGIADANPTRICAGIAKRLRPETKMVVCTHSSNICSYTFPLREIGAFCHRHGLLFVVDAAQSAGHRRIHIGDMNVDALCVPGHKGLYGPQGCGMVLLGEGIVPDTLIEGGSGVHSLSGEMPEEGPERFEAGTLPTPAIAGLSEGIKDVMRTGMDEICNHEIALYRYLRERLENMKGVILYAPEYEGNTMLFNLEGIHSETVGRRLAEMGICVRSGYHCSKLGHETLGTPEGGAVRISFGRYNNCGEIEKVTRALSLVQKEKT